jgi:hypothetical protein
LATNFDFTVSPASIVAVRGNPDSFTIDIDLIVAENTSIYAGSTCGVRFPEPPLQGASFKVQSAMGSDDCHASEVWELRVGNDAPVGVRVLHVPGSYVARLSEGDHVERVTHILTLDVRSEISVDVTAPASGVTVSDADVAVAASVSDAFGEINTVELLVGGAVADTLFTGAERTVSVAGSAALAPGENLITVRATNGVGNTWSDAVTVTYAPVTAGIVRWDGDAGDGLWFTPANWDGDVLPGPGDAVIIDAAAAEVMYARDVVTSIASLTNRGSLTLREGGLHIARASASEGDLILDHDQQTVNRPVLWLDDTLTVAGTLDCTRASVRGGKLVVVAGASTGADLCVWNDLAVENGGEVVVGGETGRLSFVGAVSLVNASDGIVRIDGGLVECTAFPCPSEVSIENHGTITMTGFRVSIDPFITNSGTIDYGTTALWLGDGQNDGAITSAGASLLVRGDWIMSASSALDATSVTVAGSRGRCVEPAGRSYPSPPSRSPSRRSPSWARGR